MDNVNEAQLELQADLDAEEKALREDGAYEMSAGERWDKIMDIMETLKVQCADLDDQLKVFNKAGLF